LEKVGVGGDFYSALADGKATAVRGSIKQFRPDGIELVDGTYMDADVVVFATGWQQNASYLSDHLRREIAPGERFRLYRHILPPTVQNLGFVGYASSFACQLTSEIGAHWLSEHFLGSLPLPSVEDMNQEIDHVHAWADIHLANRGAEGFVGPHISHYVDELMRDMRLERKRPGSYFQKHFGAVRASSFATLSEERRQLRLT
jgi:cation diffusion facilitator CzcD-associated flavoprotein CzcO